MGKKKKDTKPQHEFPFKIDTLEPHDIAMLNTPLVDERPNNKTYGRAIFSMTEDGVGDMIELNFGDIIEIGRVPEDDEDHESLCDPGECFVHGRDRKNKEFYYAFFDFRIIHF